VPERETVKQDFLATGPMSVPLSDNWKDLWVCLEPSLWLPKPLLFLSRLGRKTPDSAAVAGLQ